MGIFRFILKASQEEEGNKIDMQEVKTIFKGIDNDGDGNVDLEEFLVKNINGIYSKRQGSPLDGRHSKC